MSHETYTFCGEHTFEDYLECHQAMAARRRSWIRGLMLLYGFGLILYALLNPDAALLVIGAFLLAYAIVISPIQFRYRVKQLWKQYPSAKRAFAITIDAEGLTTTDDKGNPAFTEWARFTKFAETTALFLLYLSPRLPISLPKRLLPPDQHDSFRQLVAGSIVKPEISLD